MSELKDCPPLKYYDFNPVEHVKLCPRYTAVLGRSEDDGIGIEELDTLQLELETLLSSATRRLRALEEQRQVVGDVRIILFCISLLSLYLISKLKTHFIKSVVVCLLHWSPLDPHRLAGQEGR